MSETTTPALRRPLQTELLELHNDINGLTDCLRAAFDNVHRAFLLFERVRDQFRWLLENTAATRVLQGLSEADVSPGLENPRPDVNGLQVLNEDLENIGEDLIAGCKFGDETASAVARLNAMLKYIPRAEGFAA